MADFLVRSGVHVLILFLVAGCARPAESSKEVQVVPQNIALSVGAPAHQPPELVSPAAIDLIIRWEVGGRETYIRRYTRPICPACLTTASGVTIGIGYDLRHATPQVILDDWAAHPQRDALPPASGVGGAAAVALAREMQHVVTAFELAYAVFRDASIVRYYRIARRTFPGMEKLPPNAQGALISLVYNRGGSLTGYSRRHMRTIAETCVPREDVECIAAQLEQMVEVWRGSQIEDGMRNRRYDEARLART